MNAIGESYKTCFLFYKSYDFSLQMFEFLLKGWFVKNTHFYSAVANLYILRCSDLGYQVILVVIQDMLVASLSMGRLNCFIRIYLIFKITDSMCLVYLKGVPFTEWHGLKLAIGRNASVCDGTLIHHCDGPIGMAAMPWPFMPGLCHPHHSPSLPTRPPLLLPYTGNNLRIVRLRRLAKSCLGCNNPEILALDKHRTLLDILDKLLFIHPGKEHVFLLIVAHSVHQLFSCLLHFEWVGPHLLQMSFNVHLAAGKFDTVVVLAKLSSVACSSYIHPIPLSFFGVLLIRLSFILCDLWPRNAPCTRETLQGVLQRQCSSPYGIIQSMSCDTSIPGS